MSPSQDARPAETARRGRALPARTRGILALRNALVRPCGLKIGEANNLRLVMPVHILIPRSAVARMGTTR